MRVKERDPAKKKLAAYLRDTSNSYGRNKKSGRRSVRKRKAHVNRSFRRQTHQALTQADIEGRETQDAVEKVRRKFWRKVPDSTLAESLEFAWSGSARSKTGIAFRASKIRREAMRKLARRYGYPEWFPNNDT